MTTTYYLLALALRTARRQGMHRDVIRWLAESVEMEETRARLDEQTAQLEARGWK